MRNDEGAKEREGDCSILGARRRLLQLSPTRLAPSRREVWGEKKEGVGKRPGGGKRRPGCHDIEKNTNLASFRDHSSEGGTKRRGKEGLKKSKKGGESCEVNGVNFQELLKLYFPYDRHFRDIWEKEEDVIEDTLRGKENSLRWRSKPYEIFLWHDVFDAEEDLP